MTNATQLMIDYATLSTSGQVALLPDLGADSVIAPLTDADREALTAEYGRPATIDRGEVAYWQTSDRGVLAALRGES